MLSCGSTPAAYWPPSDLGFQRVARLSEAGEFLDRSEVIALHTEIASGIRASVGELRRAIERGTSANYDNARNWRSRRVKP